jgi:hypothetical protein
VDSHHSTCIQFVKHQLQGLSLAIFKRTMPSSRLMRPCPKRFSRFGILAVTHARIMSGMMCHREFHRVAEKPKKSTSKDTGFFRRLAGVV